MNAILLDVDGVLLDWYQGFHQWMLRQGYQATESKGNNYDLTNDYPGHDLRTRITEFSKSYPYQHLKHIQGATHGVKFLRVRYPYVPIIGVTSCGMSPEVVCARTRSLSEFALDGLIPTPISEGKGHIFRSFKTTLVIDDSPKNIQDANDAGHITLIFDQPWNRELPGMRVRGWADIYNVVGSQANV